jgi:hypothetical protein
MAIDSTSYLMKTSPVKFTAKLQLIAPILIKILLESD